MDSTSTEMLSSLTASNINTFTDTNLTDYIDIVTTYKCRFCSFTSSYPQGVSSHVRNVHMKPSTALPPAPPPPPPPPPPHSLTSMDIPTPPIVEQVEKFTSDSTVEERIKETLKIQSSEASTTLQPFSASDHISIVDKSQISTLIGSPTSGGQQVIFTQAAGTQPQVITRQNDSTGNIVSSSYLPMETAVTDGSSLTFLSQSSLESQTFNHFSVASSDSILPDTQVCFSPVKTKELFLCGRCTVGFDSIEDCKTHMIQVHNALPLGYGTNSNVKRVSVGTQVMATKKKPGRKRKNPVPVRSPSPTSDKDWEEGDSTEWFSTKGRNRRKIRPPKALKDDYYLGKNKKRTKEASVLNEGYDLKCTIQGCFAKFKKEQSLKIHKMCHMKENDKSSFVCTVCALEFSAWKHLRMHLWRNHSIDTDLFSCNSCDFRTDTVHKLLVHKEIHGDERPYTCDVCWKGFKQFSQMRNHQMIHVEYQSNESDRWYTTKQCEICKRSFANQKCLNKHIQAVHSKIKPYVCTYCGHSMARKAMLQLHIRIHTGEKPFKCDVCQYATGDHNSLRRHKMRHTGLRPYKCQYCAYSCIQAISLKTHMKNKHPGSSGIYHCDICNYRTVNSTSFTNHVNDHKNGLIEMQQEPTATSSEMTAMTTSTVTTTTAQSTSLGSKVKVQRVSDIDSASAIQAHVATVEDGVTHLSPDDIVKIAQASSDGLVSTDLTAAELIYAIANSTQHDNPVLAGMQGTINISSKEGVNTHTITLHLPPTSQSGVVTGDASSSQSGSGGPTLLMVQPIELCSVDNEGTTQTVSAENIQVAFEQAETSAVMNSENVMKTSEKSITDNSLL